MDPDGQCTHQRVVLTVFEIAQDCNTTFLCLLKYVIADKLNMIIFYLKKIKNSKI